MVWDNFDVFHLLFAKEKNWQRTQKFFLFYVFRWKRQLRVVPFPSWQWTKENDSWYHKPCTHNTVLIRPRMRMRLNRLKTPGDECSLFPFRSKIQTLAEDCNCKNFVGIPDSQTMMARTLLNFVWMKLRRGTSMTRWKLVHFQKQFASRNQNRIWIQWTKILMQKIKKKNKNKKNPRTIKIIYGMGFKLDTKSLLRRWGKCDCAADTSRVWCRSSRSPGLRCHDGFHIGERIHHQLFAVQPSIGRKLVLVDGTGPVFRNLVVDRTVVDEHQNKRMYNLPLASVRQREWLLCCWWSHFAAEALKKRNRFSSKKSIARTDKKPCVFYLRFESKAKQTKSKTQFHRMTHWCTKRHSWSVLWITQ